MSKKPRKPIPSPAPFHQWLTWFSKVPCSRSTNHCHHHEVYHSKTWCRSAMWEPPTLHHLFIAVMRNRGIDRSCFPRTTSSSMTSDVSRRDICLAHWTKILSCCPPRCFCCNDESLSCWYVYKHKYCYYHYYLYYCYKYHDIFRYSTFMTTPIQSNSWNSYHYSKEAPQMVSMLFAEIRSIRKFIPPSFPATMLVCPTRVIVQLRECL